MAAAITTKKTAAETPRDWTGVIPTRYPDPDIVSLDDRFNKLKLGNTPIQRIYHSPEMLWAEGPAWNGVGRYLLWSDIPNNVQHRWLEEMATLPNSFVIQAATVTETPSISKDGRFLVNTARERLSATNTTARSQCLPRSSRANHSTRQMTRSSIRKTAQFGLPTQVMAAS